jgi:hypothetical protein
VRVSRLRGANSVSFLYLESSHRFDSILASSLLLSCRNAAGLFSVPSWGRL